jgi:hypothetical protein
MANALFIGWGHPVRGRESMSLEVFDEVVLYFTGLLERGEIDSFEPIQLEPHGGELNGFMLIRASADRLARLRENEEFLRLLDRGSMMVEHLGAISGYADEELRRRFQVFGELAGALAGG